MTEIESYQPDPKKLMKVDILWIIIILAFEAISGIFSIYLGTVYSSYSLFCFGIAALVEIFSGILILNNVWKVKYQNRNPKPISINKQFGISGFGLYLLTAGLIVGAVVIVIKGEKPETTIFGILISIVALFFLILQKFFIKRKLNSGAFITEASAIKNIVNLLVVLFISNFLYEFSRIAWFDTLGALIIAGFIPYAGRKFFLKQKNNL